MASMTGFNLLMADVREMVSEQIGFRELLYQMTRRDLLLRYKQTIMGFGWAIFMPLVNTAVFSVIFTRIAPLDTGLPYPVFAYCGLLAWNFSASSFRFAVNSLTSNTNLVTKVYFPREIFPISAVLVSVVDFAVGSLVLVGLMAYYQVAPSWTILALPAVLLVHLVFTMAVSLILAMANLFYRDVKYLFEIVITIWMFATSVVYPVTMIGGTLVDGAPPQPDDPHHRRVSRRHPDRTAAGSGLLRMGGGVRHRAARVRLACLPPRRVPVRREYLKPTGTMLHRRAEITRPPGRSWPSTLIGPPDRHAAAAPTRRAGVLLLSEVFPPSIGGSAELLWNVYSRVEGAPVTVLTNNAAPDLPEDDPGPFEIYRRPMAYTRWGVLHANGLSRHLRIAAATRQLSVAASVVHCARALPEGFDALLSSLYTGTPFICWAHGEELTCARSSRELTWLMHRVFRRAAALVANSRNTAAQLEQAGAPINRIEVIYPGVDTVRFQPGCGGRPGPSRQVRQAR